MAHTPLKIIALEFLFVVLLVNCPHDIVGQERDLFEYEDFTTEIDELQAREGSIIIGEKKKGPRLPATKPFLQVAQGRHMLFYIPGVKHCDQLSFQLWDEAFLKWNDLGCSEADSIGWMWAFDCVPDKLNKYRVFGKLNFRPILFGEIIALADRPPPIVSHAVDIGPGWVALWVRLPEEEYPNVLGIKVRFTDEEFGKSQRRDGLRGQRAFDNSRTIFTNKRYFHTVQYAGDRAMLWPVHYCPQWPKTNMFCMLFTDKFIYSRDFVQKQKVNLKKLKGWGTAKMPKTPSYVVAKKIFFMMETFRIPYYYPMSVHGDKYNITVQHYNCDPWNDCGEFSGHLPAHDKLEQQLDELMTGPMFDESPPRKRPKRRPWPRESQLWVIFIVLSLFILAVIFPLLFYFGTRAGFRAADAMWTSWAEAPGHVIVGLGYTTVGWRGEHLAWKYERGGK